MKTRHLIPTGLSASLTLLTETAATHATEIDRPLRMVPTHPLSFEPASGRGAQQAAFVARRPGYGWQ